MIQTAKSTVVQGPISALGRAADANCANPPSNISPKGSRLRPANKRSR